MVKQLKMLSIKRCRINAVILSLQPEVIFLHIGQAGIQAGQSFWEQMCAEHAVAPDGYYNPNCSPDVYLDSIFEFTSRGTLSPRAFCIDTDPVSLGLFSLL